MARYGKMTKLAMMLDEAKMLEKHHRAKSRRQFHPASVKRLATAKRRLQRAVSKL